MKFLTRRARHSSQNGIALVSVLMVSVVLLALAGAFFAAHKTDLALMGASTRLEKTKNAALSAADFFQYKLQNNRYFGSIAFTGAVEEFPDDTEPLLKVVYEGDGVDPRKNVVKGTIIKTGLNFEGQVLNNLDGNTVVSVRRLDKKGWLSTPPRSARVFITTNQGHIKRNMDFILKRSPFTGVSILAGGNVDVDLSDSKDGHWWLGARQPSGNAVRANGTVRGPEVLSSTGRAVLFEPPEGLDKLKPPYGVIQGQNLSMQLNGVPTEVEAGDSRLEKIHENIDGVLSPGGVAAQIPTLDPSKLTAPVRTFPVKAEKITFRSVDNGDGRVIHQLFYGDSGTPIHQYDPTDPTSTRTVKWTGASDHDVIATLDLESRVMSVTPNVELQSPEGKFLVASDGGNQPTLVLGNEWGAASIEADRGIEIAGSVGGKGALKAGKGDLAIRAKSSLSTTPDFGIALHSEFDVILSQPESSNSDGIPADWDAFKKALTVAESKKRGYLDEINSWNDLSDKRKSVVAASFSEEVLSKPGTDPGDDPLFMALSEEFEGDDLAIEVYKEWMKKEEKILIPPPDPPPGDTGGTGDTGDTGGTGGSGDTGGTSDTGDIGDTGGTGDTGDTGGTGDTGDPVDPGEPTAPVEPPAPEYEIIPAGPGLTVENYVRMREYMRTVKAQKPDDSWLKKGENPQRDQDVARLIRNQLSSFHLAAGQISKEKDGHVTLEWNSLSSYFEGDNPFRSGYRADMKFRGLIYAGQNFTFDTNDRGIEIEGALVAHSNVSILNATGARFIYNSELLENLFATNEGDHSAKLERAYWAYY